MLCLPNFESDFGNPILRLNGLHSSSSFTCPEFAKQYRVIETNSCQIGDAI